MPVMSCLVTVSPLGFGLSLCLESLAALETSSVSQLKKLSASFAAFTFTQVPFGLFSHPARLTALQAILAADSSLFPAFSAELKAALQTSAASLGRTFFTGSGRSLILS